MSGSISETSYKQCVAAWRNGDFTKVRELAAEAKQRFLAKGLVKAEPAFNWIEKEWLERGLREGVIIYKDGEYYLTYQEKEVEDIKGYRGRTPISGGKKIVADSSKTIKFLNEYEEFKKKQSQQHFVVNEEIKSLINFGIEQKDRGDL